MLGSAHRRARSLPRRSDDTAAQGRDSLSLRTCLTPECQDMLDAAGRDRLFPSAGSGTGGRDWRWWRYRSSSSGIEPRGGGEGVAPVGARVVGAPSRRPVGAAGRALAAAAGRAPNQAAAQTGGTGVSGAPRAGEVGGASLCPRHWWSCARGPCLPRRSAPWRLRCRGAALNRLAAIDVNR
jgi:hypothetical protein